MSENALPWAKMLAGEDRTLRLLHCADSHLSSKDEESRRSGEEQLQRLSDTYGLSQVEFSLKGGKAAETILSESQAEDVEAIVLTSHGASGLGKWLVGSVTSKVLKGSAKPVYVVRAGQSQVPKLQKIVLCLDGSPLAERGLESGTQLARRFDAELKLIQAVNHQGYSAADLNLALEQSAAYLKDQAARFSGLKIETAVRASGVLEGILKETSGYDLTVVTSHGQGGFQRWLLGSLTEKLLHLGQTSLLVIPAG